MKTPYKIMVGIPQEKLCLGRTGMILIIRYDLKGLGLESVDWIQLDESRVIVVLL